MKIKNEEKKDCENEFQDLLFDYWIIYKPLDNPLTNGYMIESGNIWSYTISLMGLIIDRINNDIIFIVSKDNQDIDKIFELRNSDPKLARELLLGIHEENKITTESFLNKLKSIYEKGV
jgi:hypothetical protein